jgi:hypothetical protein
LITKRFGRTQDANEDNEYGSAAGFTPADEGGTKEKVKEQQKKQ